MKMAAESAHTKLLKYYNKVMLLYCIASALDLRINMEYFRNEDWEEHLIKEWRTIMEDIWVSYKPSEVNRISVEDLDEEPFVSSIYKKRQRITPRDELEQQV